MNWATKEELCAVSERITLRGFAHTLFGWGFGVFWICPKHNMKDAVKKWAALRRTAKEMQVVEK